MRLMLLMIAALALAVPVLALDYDQNVTPDVIFGTGNDNGSFTVFTDTTPYGDTIEVGLRGKVRFNASGLPENTFNSDGMGGYYFLAGGPGGLTPTWCFEWTVNTTATEPVHYPFKVGSFTYELGLDFDPSPAVTDYVVFDPITPTVDTPYFDHAMGDNTTANGGGVEATNATEYQTYLDQYNVAQQSWRYDWFAGLSPLSFDPNNAGVYDIYLKVFSMGTEIAHVNISISVGGAVANEDASWSEIKSLFR